MKKRVYISWSHHHVIREWFRYSGCGIHLLSFDYHTDFHEAFIKKSGTPSDNFTCSSKRYNFYLKKHIPCNDIEAAIKDLKYDEHIDFALRSGMIKKAFVFSSDEYVDEGRVLTVPPIEMSEEQVQFVEFMRNFAPTVVKNSPCHDDNISHDGYAETRIEYGIVSFPECRHPLLMANDELQKAKHVTTDDVLNEVIKTFGKQGFDQSNYILDFDCDFIRDRDAMAHRQLQTLKELIRGAKSITIAREPGCVHECSGGTLDYEEIETWFVGLIQDCVDDVEIERET